MYEKFFGLKENPFSIAPDPRYLYMSERHRDALAHLLFGIEREGGVVVLTGEVGTGKTTLCRYFLQRLPDNVEMAFILHPKLTARELLGAICDEFGIRVAPLSQTKALVDAIHAFLLEKHAAGIHLALLIDEAQNLSPDVLEELRLLTNLETDQKKLLQIILLGQPELRELLARDNLRQLAQRVTARYHLDALNPVDVRGYLSFRLSVAGCTRDVFDEGAIRKIVRLSEGIPRLINLIADRALLGAYSENLPMVTAAIVRKAAREVGFLTFRKRSTILEPWLLKSVVTGAVAGCLTLWLTVWGFGVLRSAQGPIAVVPGTSPAEAGSQGSVALQSNGGDPSLAAALPAGVPAAANLPASAAGPTGAVAADTTKESQPVEPGTGSAAEQETGIPETASSATSSLPASTQAALSSAQTSATLPSLPALPAASAVTPTSVRQNSPFADYLAGRDNTYHAYLALLRAWGVMEDPGKRALACDFAERYGLRCLHRKGNWRSLVALDRPVIMRLLNDRGRSFQVTLISLESSGRAQVILDGASQVTDLAELDRRWDGDYSLFYKLPPYLSRRISPGAVQDEDDWVSAQLHEMTVRWLATGGEGPPPPPDTASLKDRVRWFQSVAGIEQDGVVGTMTLISLNSWLDPTIPRLSRRRSGGGS